MECGDETRQSNNLMLASVWTMRFTASVAADTTISQEFHRTLSASHQFRVSETDLLKLNDIRKKNLAKHRRRQFELIGLPLDDPSQMEHGLTWFKSRNSQQSSVDDSRYPITTKNRKNSRVDTEYLYILLAHLKKYNPFCGLCVDSRYFGRRNMPPTGLLLRVVLVCAGRPHCQFKCSVTLQNSGQCYVFPIQNSVRHNARQRVCRPIREPLRKILKDKFKSGASVCAIHREYSAKRTSSEKSAFNYDFTGSTRKTFKKIKAEATVDTLLDPDEGKSLDELYKSTMAQINPGGKVPGALQVVCRHPLHLIVHTEASIRLFDCLVSSPHSIISWDATGSVVKAKNGKTILYYELTMTQSNVVEENSLIPITFMISESHTLKMVVNWMNWLKEHYKKTFEGKQFPKPEFVLSDRAQVFLQASLEVFNNSESYEMFLDRAYRIVTGQPHTNDLQQTNIHACLAHVMLAFRKITNKFMSSDLRELAMWAVAVIINTSVWSDMVANWRLICEYFLNLDTDKHDPIHHSLLMYRIQSLDANPNIQTCLRHQFTVKTEMKDNYKFEDGSTDDDDNTITKKIMSTSTKKLKTMSGLRTIDEEAELNSFNSLFRTTFNRIFEQCLESRGNAVNIKKETTMRMKGNCDWLTYLNKNFMPTVAIWSNLLLGNLKRHCSKVRSFNRFLLDKEIQRTTANSERRMGILKRTQLGGEVHGRLDVVLSILIQDLVQFVHSFTLGIVNVNLNANQSLQQEHFIPVQEQ
ncbi:unnamed protein product [Didymodactylos carnosus]|uniref:Uncharacterized protein n=1 Tax=Didymodactylos carnosus TaxID=1234261 RepID=A0A8S2I5I2_9BILA|nr:unnamed protein product [Didymodactylos carnosus]